ncbi:hypothetical protein CHUAL_004380 [Chamberlinius hualienensis]
MVMIMDYKASLIIMGIMIIYGSYGNPIFDHLENNEIDMPPLGTCRQECAGYNVGCPPGYVCCRTGCGHVCQKHKCPKIKLTPYPFCLTHCPFREVDNKSIRAYCLCYNACMNVRCGKEEMCIPKPAKCDKEMCLPIGVCVSAVHANDQQFLSQLTFI